MKPLALIPARAGSKRLPGKHLLDLGGKPLIAWTIEAAKESGVFERIMVSSDDSDILALAEFHGLDYHHRAPRLARDHVTLGQALRKVARDIRWAGPIFILQATHPFRRSASIQNAWSRFESCAGLAALIGITPACWPREWLLRGSADSLVRPRFKTMWNMPRNRTEKLLYPNGAVWIVANRSLLGRIWPSPTLGFAVDERESLEIDTPGDLAYARWLLTQPDAA